MIKAQAEKNIVFLGNFFISLEGRRRIYRGFPSSPERRGRCGGGRLPLLSDVGVELPLLVLLVLLVLSPLALRAVVDARSGVLSVPGLPHSRIDVGNRDGLGIATLLRKRKASLDV